jgi:hypothetical protein
LLAALLLSVALQAQEKPVAISGVLFGDAYQFVSSSSPALDGQNGFILRRGYLTFDKGLSETLSARLRFEVAQPGDYRTNANMEPFVKDAFLRWKQSARFELVAGISPTPTWETIERVWGYRAVERTAAEVFRFGSSRDFGLAAMGTLDAAKRVRYHVMAGNGAGVGTETNTGKKIAAALSYGLTKETLVEVYADRIDADRTTTQLFGAWQRENARAGVQFTRQTRGDGDLHLASLFGVVNVRPNVAVLARIDRMFEPHPEADRISYLPMSTTSAPTLFLAGVDWKVHKYVSIIPNVTLVTYEDDGVENEVLAKVTLSVAF